MSITCGLWRSTPPICARALNWTTRKARLRLRRIWSTCGRWNLVAGGSTFPNISVFLWRLQAYRLARAELVPETSVSDGYWINPVQIDTPVYNSPRTDIGTEDRSEPRSVPDPLRRRALFDELEARRQALASGAPLPRHWFDERPTATAPSVFSLMLDEIEVPPEQIVICDLSTWREVPSTLDYSVTQPDGTTSVVSLPIAAGVDPKLGRLRLSAGRAGSPVKFDHAYGFPGDLGAGSYSRRAHLDALLSERDVTFSVGVSRAAQTPGTDIFATFAEAVAVWNAQPAGSVGVIAVMDSGLYSEDLTGSDRIEVPEGSRLVIAGANWPAVQDPAAPVGTLIRAARKD